MVMKSITVLLAEDHMIVREGLRSLLQAEAGIEVVGEAQTGRQAVQLTKELRPAVVVMDIAMPLLNGLEATRQILKAVPATKVLILSAHNDDAYVEQVIALGAAGYLLKQTSLEDLSKAIREAHKGNKFFSPSGAS
jgi:DNA-binding NarL/FixJ family response regulator